MSRPRTGLRLAPPDPPAPPPDPLDIWRDGVLSEPECCDFLSLSRPVVDDLRRRGVLVQAAHGRKVLIAKRSAMAYLEKLRVQSAGK